MIRPFSYSIAMKMFEFVAERLAKNGGCDGTLTNTYTWLVVYYDYDDEKVEQALEFLYEHGGHCDCEVLLNVDKKEYWEGKHGNNSGI